MIDYRIANKRKYFSGTTLRLKNLPTFVCLVQIAYGSQTVTNELGIDDSNYSDDFNQQSCNSQIYCNSQLLHDVQMSRLYGDSKTFVDMKLKFPERHILAEYERYKTRHGNNLTKEMLRAFVDDHFENGDELQVWVPPDFNDNPSIVGRIANPTYKLWASKLNGMWKTLARRVKEDVKINPDQYSLIWVPNGFVIPGGRFKELYYWDTYWIVNGLLLCDMTTTARGVIDNIVYMVKQFGFMPNGERVYYQKRSQPPMLMMMVQKYYEKTDDFDYIKGNINDLETEFQFWKRNRMITFEKDGKPYTMARYYAPSKGPRPESYREDYEIAETYGTKEKRNDFYVRIKSTAETGWDFSSRWFMTANGSNDGNLSDIQTPNIVPVDLNCMLQKNAQLLSTWFRKMGNEQKANEYNTIANQFLNNIHNVLWRDDKGAWFDWDMLNSKHRDYFYVSNIAPLWTDSYNMPKDTVANKVIQYLKNENIIQSNDKVTFKGTPTSMVKTNEQWDFPNAWPPLQAFIIQGLKGTGQEHAQSISKNLADVWLKTNYKGFEKTSSMFEKYNVLVEGDTGTGGEYVPQTGFGWTNGFVFELLDCWG